MPELRKDPITGRWVVVSTERQKRPNDFVHHRADVIGREHCPFCPGSEGLTPAEVLDGPRTVVFDDMRALAELVAGAG